MIIRDLPGHTELKGIKIKSPDGVVGYFEGSWGKGVWLSKEGKGGQITPYFLEDVKEVLEWECNIEDPVTVN